MAITMSIVLFLLMKASVLALGYFLCGFFKIRYDTAVLIFYGALSLFQFVFFIVQSAAHDAQSGARVTFMRYTTLIAYFMEIVIVAGSGYYLYLQGADILNVAYFAVAAAGAGELFYTAHRAAFAPVVRKAKVRFRTAGTASAILFPILAYLPALAYFGVKQFVAKRPLELMDFYLLAGVLGVHFISTLWQLWSNVLRAKRTARTIAGIDLNAGKFKIEVTDAGGIGYIQSEFASLTDKLAKEKENLSLLNGYLSDNIFADTEKYGLPLTGELKNAAVLTVLYGMNAELTPENELNAVAAITQMIGAYAGDYDAFPLLSPGKAVLAFGVPFHYEHQKYNSIECASKIIDDVRKYAEESAISISVHTGIFSGNILCGAIRSRGPAYKEYVFFGEGVEKSAKIAAIARKMDIPLLTCENTVDKLKSKFYVQKSYKTKLTDDETIVLNQIKT